MQQGFVHFVSKCKVSQQNAGALCTHVFWEICKVLHAIAKFLSRTRKICEQIRSFSGELKSFTSEGKVFCWKAQKVCQQTQTFLRERERVCVCEQMQRFSETLPANTKVLKNRKSFESKCSVFQRNANVLRANAKALKHTISPSLCPGAA